ncbi:hypothetical protein [Rubripirellula tenax]|uniref:hypothetical protein n=1 Tax=Rubripirellula tenax TaxID=2528015 RepID=UPI0011B7CEE7|nr:hypothetical protein [Rubripirellula tenax]
MSVNETGFRETAVGQLGGVADAIKRVCFVPAPRTREVRQFVPITPDESIETALGVLAHSPIVLVEPGGEAGRHPDGDEQPKPIKPRVARPWADI